MSLNQLFDTVEKAREAANWRAAFGEPQAAEGITVIPVARVGYAFGLGFGQGTGVPVAEGEPVSEGEGGGGGGGTSAKPMGAFVITPETVYFEEVEDSTKIAIAGILMMALFILQLALTLRAIFGRK